jgi:hypothetical protein
MIEPVREGSRLSWSMMRASGCGGMPHAYRSFRETVIVNSSCPALSRSSPAMTNERAFAYLFGSG